MDRLVTIRPAARLIAVLMCATAALLAFGAISALAAAPTLSVDPSPTASYASSEVSGEVDPADNEVFYWFQYSHDPDSEDWTNGPEIYARTLAANSGPISVSESFAGLKGGTEYKVRLVAFRTDESEIWTSEAPYATFTTLPVDPPTAVSIDDASELGYTTSKATGQIERPANADPAFDAHCRFEYVADQQFGENQTNAAPLFEGAGAASCQPEAAEETPGESDVSAELRGLAVGTTYHLRLSVSNAGGADSVEAADTFTTLAPGAPSVSLDPITNFTATTADFSGHITPGGTDPAFDVTWQFHCSPECPGPSGGTIAGDSGSHLVEADATGLEPNTEYQVELIATNAGSAHGAAGPEGFQTPPVAPLAKTLPAFALGDGTGVLLGGRVDPENSSTRYWIEYGTGTSYGASAPASEDAEAGSGSQAQILTQEAIGLIPGTVYHYRLVAKNATETSRGADMTFETPAPAPSESCPNAVLRAEDDSTALPDCRAYEQVSPVDKNGYDAETQAEIPVFVAAEDGSAFSFESYGAFGDSVSASFLDTYLSRRGASGWTTQALNPPAIPSQKGDFPTFQYLTPDLQRGIVRVPAGPPLGPGATPNAASYYLRDNGTGTYQTLSLGGTDPGSEFRFVAASADAKHVLFESTARLTPDSPTGASRNLYEWSDGEIHVVPVIDGTPIPAGGSLEAGALIFPTTHAISEDGSRVVFKSEEGGPGVGQLYLREDGQPTVEVSASHRSTPDPGGPGFVHFAGASADASQIFFLSTEALTDDAELGAQSLYRYNAEAKTLTDLSAEPLAGRGGVEGVAAISTDGSDVYFYSKGQFVAGQGDAGHPNLYLWHSGTIFLIAADTAEGDGPTWANRTTYRLSSDSRYLTFATESRLTAYDNTDALTGAADGEVYRYDSQLKTLTCVSCNPDGEAPDGPSGFPGPPARQERNLQPGAFDDGNVFFNSSDALVPEDVNGKQDVYEWKSGRPYLISSGNGSDPALYASASKNGEDIFFVTRQQLIASDKDQLIDVYDAHVDGGFLQDSQVSPCDAAEACHGAAGSEPSFVNPVLGSSPAQRGFSPRARRLKAALRACRKRPTKARAKCRAHAKKALHHGRRAG